MIFGVESRPTSFALDILFPVEGVGFQVDFVVPFGVESFKAKLTIESFFITIVELGVDSQVVFDGEGFVAGGELAVIRFDAGMGPQVVPEAGRWGEEGLVADFAVVSTFFSHFEQKISENINMCNVKFTCGMKVEMMKM